jgi:hypothetical protein
MGVGEAAGEEPVCDLGAVRWARRLGEASGEGAIQESLALARDLALGQRVEREQLHAAR